MDPLENGSLFGRRDNEKGGIFAESRTPWVTNPCLEG